MSKIYSKIIGTGSYLPERVLTNAEVAEKIDTTDEWIRERTGIYQRHIVADGQTTCDLAEQASLRAIKAAGLEPNDIDLIVFATTTPDQIFPSTACLLQKKLRIDECPAFDIQAVCTGFIYALDVANRFIKTNGAKRALVIGAESMSRIIDWTDRGTCILFGDGAGAVIIEASDEPGILSSHIHANGDYDALLQVPAGKSYMTMQGNEVFKTAVNTLGRIVDETLEANNLQKRDIDWLIPHQANIRIIQATARKLKMNMDHVVVTVREHGNTSAASVPLALDHAVRSGKIKRGELLLLEAFGGGFTWGSALVKY
ncbi:MAG: beta-ketoacyl-ACP synthase III [Gammaproteobacteria bacterium]